MRTRKTTAFRPFLETAEPRIVAAAGLTSAAHALAHAQPHHPAPVSSESHHASPKVNHQATATAKHHTTASNSHLNNHTSGTTTTTTTTTTKTTTRTTTTTSTINSTPHSSLPTNTTTNQAWVELINMTGRDLEYQIKLGPYANGQFLDYDIAGQGPNSVQDRYSSLISDGRRVEPDFAIQFGNGPVTPLLTGISQQSAQEYYIFMGADGQYYVAPTFTMSGSF